MRNRLRSGALRDSQRGPREDLEARVAAEVGACEAMQAQTAWTKLQSPLWPSRELLEVLKRRDVQPMHRPGPERAADGEEADARGYLPGWAAQCPPPVRERERLPKASDKQGQGDDVDAHVHRSGDAHRQGPSSMDLDETSSTHSKKGSPSSSVQASAKSDGRHRQSQMTHIPTEEDALHIPGVPEHDTCPSVWPAFLAANREKREKAEKAERAGKGGSGSGGSGGSLGSGSLGSGSLSSGSKKEGRHRQERGAPGARAAPGAKEKEKEPQKKRSPARPPLGQPGGPGSEGSEGRRRRPSQEEDLDEAAFEAAAAAARQAAEEAAQAAKAAQLQEQVAAQREAQLKDLESQLVAAKRRNEELEAAAALAARREEELAAQAAEMQDLASKLSSTKQRNQELEAAAAAAAKAASKAAKEQAARAAVEERAREVAEAAATAAWASAKESHIAEMRARPVPAQEAESEAVSWAPPATGLPQALLGSKWP
ncbi:pol [Symbiodinium sp. CCMP2592]|nr:pol [Symbiodinium sp. CCMP2592]